jgi:branched-chain amino acid transport system permease protein
LDWTKFIQLTIDGLTLGGVYALIALGFSMVYGVLKLLNFAHGDVYMIGSFLGYGVLTGLGGAASPNVATWLLITLMFGGAMLGCGILGILIERVAYRPLRNAPRIAPLISALGVAFFLENSVLLLLGANFFSFDTFEFVDPTVGIRFGSQYVWIMRALVISLAFVSMILLTFLVNRTQLGKAMRAISFDREAAAMMGINVDRVIASTFFIGSVLAGAAGVMFGLLYSQIFHLMGFLAGLKGFTAAVVGGIGSIPGAMLGGLVVGLTESYAAGYLGGQWSDLTVFGILIFVLLVRPSGLLGGRAIQKV